MSERLLGRRSFLAAGLAAPLLGVSTGCGLAEPRFSANPFTLGIASGDPAPDGVVLWTRLATDPLHGGGLPPDESYQVHWRIASDSNMLQVVQQGTAEAVPEWGHSVHVEVSGLEPGRWYWYQFRAGSEESPRGRTRTAEGAGASLQKLRFAVASCQHYEHGYFTAYRHMASEDLELVVHLGDYIYEGAGKEDSGKEDNEEEGRPRRHFGGEIKSLAAYRNRYALYKSDPDLQAAHAAFPWVVTWDDHEFDNNYASGIPEEKAPAPRDAFLARRAAAYHAYYEHMPLRRSAMPSGPRMQLYRSLSYGNLARFSVLDTRQYRSDQPCGDRNKPLCEGVFDPAATMLGSEQEDWLGTQLRGSDARWNLLAQQVMMGRVDRLPGPEKLFSMDQWSGYEAPRKRLLASLREGAAANPVVLTGDIHANWVNDLKVDFDDPRSTAVATEFVGTSITSGGDGSDLREETAGVLRENPFVKFFNNQRGYIRCTLTPELCRADYQVMDFVEKPGGTISTRASFVVENGRPGAVPA